MIEIARLFRSRPLIRCQMVGDLWRLLGAAVADPEGLAIDVRRAGRLDPKGGPMTPHPPNRAAPRDSGPPKPDRDPAISKKGPALAGKGAP